MSEGVLSLVLVVAGVTLVLRVSKTPKKTWKAEIILRQVGGGGGGGGGRKKSEAGRVLKGPFMHF